MRAASALGCAGAAAEASSGPTTVQAAGEEAWDAQAAGSRLPTTVSGDAATGTDRPANVEAWLDGTDDACRPPLHGDPTKSDVEHGRAYCSTNVRGASDYDHTECLERCRDRLARVVHHHETLTASDRRAFDEALQECIAHVEQTLGHDVLPCHFKKPLPAGAYEQCDSACRARAMQVRHEWEPAP